MICRTVRVGGTKDSFHHFVVPLPREGGSDTTASDESNAKYSNIFWAFYCISSSAEGGANKPPSRGRGTAGGGRSPVP